MPTVSNGPEDSVAATPDTTAQDAPLELEGFAEAISGIGFQPEVEGEPEPAEAVDEAETTETPPEAPSSEEQPEVETEINFDGFSPAQKETWQRLHKEGYATPQEIETARIESMFQSSYTKKTTALADARKALEASAKENEEDLALLERIRADDHLHAAWLKMSQKGVSTDESYSDEDEDLLVDAKTAAKIADKRFEQREAERLARTNQEQAAYASKQKALTDAIQDSIQTLGVTPDQMTAYLDAEAEFLPEGADPVLIVEPAELQRLVLRRHELETVKAEAARLREELNQRQSRDGRTAKQSLAPASRNVERVQMSALQQTEADLGLDPDWSNVQGFGFRDGR